MKTLMHFRDFVNEITTSASRKHKQDVLAKYKDDEVVKQYLKIAYDPYTVFGISTKKLNKTVAGMNAYPCDIFELFEYLTSHNTGSDADIKVCQATLDDVFSKDIECSHLLEELICKDLSIGCDAKTINSVIPDLIPTFNVMLAEKFFDKPDRVDGKEFALTTKIDGGRIIALKENGSVSFFTRAGQKYEGLVDLENELKKLPFDNFCLDGEITLLDYQNHDSKDAYKQAMKITRKDGEKHGVKMLIFDGMPVEDFRNQKCNLSWHKRREIINSMFLFAGIKYKFFEVLPVLYKGTDTSKITELLNSETARGQEGIMINVCDAPYEFKRSSVLLKVKKFNSCDLRIKGFEEGSGRLKDTLGAIICEYKGNEVRVGSGFTDWLRNEIWNNQSKYLGTIVEVSFFEETQDSNGILSLRFPTFKDFRPDLTEPNY